MCCHCEERRDVAIRPFFPQKRPRTLGGSGGVSIKLILVYSSARALAAAMAFSWAAGGQSS